LTRHIERPDNLTTNSSNTFMHIHGPERKRDYATIGNQKAMSRKRDRISGLDSVQYKIVSRDALQFPNIKDVFSIGIELKCNKSWTAYCEFPKKS
jgi:xylosylprotein 4-beta-galactosyltransferase